MLTPIFAVLTTLLTAVTALPIGRDVGHGIISQPSSGAAIRPGEAFNFTYIPMADYSVSTFYYHVLLLNASSPDSHDNLLNQPASTLFTSGYYFGRYDCENYPGMCIQVTRKVAVMLTSNEYLSIQLYRILRTLHQLSLQCPISPRTLLPGGQRVNLHTISSFSFL